MFGSVSFNEILLILVLALLIFGPQRLPQIGRTIGRAMGEFRRATTDLKRTVEAEMASIDEAAAAPPAAGDKRPTGAPQAVERGAATESESAETS